MGCNHGPDRGSDEVETLEGDALKVNEKRDGCELDHPCKPPPSCGGNHVSDGSSRATTRGKPAVLGGCLDGRCSALATEKRAVSVSLETD